MTGKQSDVLGACTFPASTCCANIPLTKPAALSALFTYWLLILLSHFNQNVAQYKALSGLNSEKDKV